MKKGPFTMKGSPMQRNFGISPVKQDDPTVQDTVDSGTFDQAFAAAKKAGKQKFTWRGDPFTTESAKPPTMGSPPKSGDGRPS